MGGRPKEAERGPAQGGGAGGGKQRIRLSRGGRGVQGNGGFMVFHHMWECDGWGCVTEDGRLWLSTHQYLAARRGRGQTHGDPGPA